MRTLQEVQADIETKINEIKVSARCASRGSLDKQLFDLVNEHITIIQKHLNEAENEVSNIRTTMILAHKRSAV